MVNRSILILLFYIIIIFLSCGYEPGPTCWSESDKEYLSSGGFVIPHIDLDYTGDDWYNKKKYYPIISTETFKVTYDCILSTNNTQNIVKINLNIYYATWDYDYEWLNILIKLGDGQGNYLKPYRYPTNCYTSGTTSNDPYSPYYKDDTHWKIGSVSTKIDNSCGEMMYSNLVTTLYAYDAAWFTPGSTELSVYVSADVYDPGTKQTIPYTDCMLENAPPEAERFNVIEVIPGQDETVSQDHTVTIKFTNDINSNCLSHLSDYIEMSMDDIVPIAAKTSALSQIAINPEIDDSDNSIVYINTPDVANDKIVYVKVKKSLMDVDEKELDSEFNSSYYVKSLVINKPVRYQKYFYKENMGGFNSHSLVEMDDPTQIGISCGATSYNNTCGSTTPDWSLDYIGTSQISSYNVTDRKIYVTGLPENYKDFGPKNLSASLCGDFTDVIINIYYQENINIDVTELNSAIGFIKLLPGWKDNTSWKDDYDGSVISLDQNNVPAWFYYWTQLLNDLVVTHWQAEGYTLPGTEKQVFDYNFGEFNVNLLRYLKESEYNEFIVASGGLLSALNIGSFDVDYPNEIICTGRYLTSSLTSGSIDLYGLTRFQKFCVHALHEYIHYCDWWRIWPTGNRIPDQDIDFDLLPDKMEKGDSEEYPFGLNYSETEVIEPTWVEGKEVDGIWVEAHWEYHRDTYNSDQDNLTYWGEQDTDLKYYLEKRAYQILNILSIQDWKYLMNLDDDGTLDWSYYQP